MRPDYAYYLLSAGAGRLRVDIKTLINQARFTSAGWIDALKRSVNAEQGARGRPSDATILEPRVLFSASPVVALVEDTQPSGEGSEQEFALAQQAYEKPTALAMGGDLLIARPTLLAITAVGTVGFVASLIFRD